MNSTKELPAQYVKLCKIDLQNDRKLAVLVNALALGIAVLLIFFANQAVPFTALFATSQGMALYIVRLVAMLAGIVVYMVLHELVHGIFMKQFSGVRPCYGFTGLYAYAGSTAYFGKRQYFVIALAPVVLLGIVLAVAVTLVPQAWFWPLYLIQVTNLSGAAGDLYVTCKLWKLPPQLLVQDAGVAMTLYVPAADKP